MGIAARCVQCRESGGRSRHVAGIPTHGARLLRAFFNSAVRERRRERLIRAPSTPSTGTCSDNRPGKNAFLRCEGYIPHCADSYLLCKGYLEWLIQGIGRPMPMPFRRFGRSATWAGTPCKADSCPGKRKCTPYNRVIHNFPPFCLK